MFHFCISEIAYSIRTRTTSVSSLSPRHLGRSIKLTSFSRNSVVQPGERRTLLFYQRLGRFPHTFPYCLPLYFTSLSSSLRVMLYCLHQLNPLSFRRMSFEEIQQGLHSWDWDHTDPPSFRIIKSVPILNPGRVLRTYKKMWYDNEGIVLPH